MKANEFIAGSVYLIPRFIQSAAIALAIIAVSAAIAHFITPDPWYIRLIHTIGF